MLIRIALSTAAAVCLALAGPVPAPARADLPEPPPPPVQTEAPAPDRDPGSAPGPTQAPGSAVPETAPVPDAAQTDDADRPPRGQYQVDAARGDDTTGTGSPRKPFRTITRALAAAQPGETVSLRPGTYDEHVVTVRPGVTVTGPRSAVVRGDAAFFRSFEVQHDDITLRGFTMDGKVCEALVEACFRDKAIYVQSFVPHDGVTGTRIEGMRITNFGGECVRIKYFATRSVVSGNRIGPCGIYDFAVPNTGTGQNGEAVYLGTAPEQLNRNPTPEPDETNDNVIRDNVIDTRGSECVDIKEAASGNDVAFNDCTGQLARNANSGAMHSRGAGNTFRSNKIHDNAGAGVGFGGDVPGDAGGNDVFDNVITNNAGGGIKLQDPGPQGKVCGNRMSGNAGGNVVGAFPNSIGDPTARC